PAADAGAFVRRDVEGMPAGRFGAGEFLPIIEREGQVARGVALAPMRQRFGEISPAVPLRALRRVRCESRIGVESPRPKNHRPALIEWKAERVGAVRRAYRRPAKQIGFD